MQPIGLFFARYKQCIIKSIKHFLDRFYQLNSGVDFESTFCYPQIFPKNRNDCLTFTFLVNCILQSLPYNNFNGLSVTVDQTALFLASRQKVLYFLVKKSFTLKPNMILHSLQIEMSRSFCRTMLSLNFAKVCLSNRLQMGTKRGQGTLQNSL